MAADLTNYFNSIATIRTKLVGMGKWSPDKPYSSKDDAETNNYYNSTVTQKRNDDGKYTDSFFKDQIAHRAVTAVKNGALTTLFTTIQKGAKIISDKNVEHYYNPAPAPGSSPNVASQRNALLKTQTGDLAKLDQARAAKGITTGKNVDTSGSDFPYKNIESEIAVPGPTFTTNNPDKMATFQSLSGAKDIQDLYTKNEAQGKAVRTYGADHDKNRFTNTLVAGLNEFPKPGEDVTAHDKIGEFIADRQVYPVGGTPMEPKENHYKSWTPRSRAYGIGRAATRSNPGSSQTDQLNQKYNTLMNQQNPTVGSYKFFIEKLHGRQNQEGSLTPYKRNPIKSRKGELIPAELENRMVFPAYVTTFNDSYDVSWDSYDFIGRGESFYAWKGTTRSLTLEFYVMSDVSTQLLTAAAKQLESDQSSKSGQTKGKDPGTGLNNTINLTRTQHDVATIQNGQLFDAAGNPLDDLEITDKEKFQAIVDLFPDWGLGTTPLATQTNKGRKGFVPGEISGTPDQLWERVTFLSQCTYGWYRQDGKLKEQPIVRIRIADFFDVSAIINSLQFTQDEFDVDLNLSTTVGALPTGIKVSINATILHEDEPSSEYRKFYHRKDRDSANTQDAAKTETAGPTGDSVLNKAQSKSPINVVAKNLNNRGPLAFPAEAAVFQASANSLDSSLKDLHAGAGSLNDASKRDKLKQALQAAQTFLKLQQAYTALQLPSTVDETKGLKQSMANQPLGNSVTLPKLFGDKKPNNGPSAAQGS